MIWTQTVHISPLSLAICMLIFSLIFSFMIRFVARSFKTMVTLLYSVKPQDLLLNRKFVCRMKASKRKKVTGHIFEKAVNLWPFLEFPYKQNLNPLLWKLFISTPLNPFDKGFVEWNWGRFIWLPFSFWKAGCKTKTLFLTRLHQPAIRIGLEKTFESQCRNMKKSHRHITMPLFNTFSLGTKGFYLNFFLKARFKVQILPSPFFTG